MPEDAILPSRRLENLKSYKVRNVLLTVSQALAMTILPLFSYKLHCDEKIAPKTDNICLNIPFALCM
jgi:hypothetical protein